MYIYISDKKKEKHRIPTSRPGFGVIFFVRDLLDDFFQFAKKKKKKKGLRVAFYE